MKSAKQTIRWIFVLKLVISFGTNLFAFKNPFIHLDELSEEITHMRLEQRCLLLLPCKVKSLIIIDAFITAKQSHLIICGHAYL